MPTLSLEYFPSLRAIPGLRHLISTRTGGESTGPYASLNLGYHVGDDPARVTANRRRLGDGAGYVPDALVAAQQVHGARVARVRAADRGRGAFGWDDALPETDALLVADLGVPVAIQVADCAPLLLVDPDQRALAVVHAGWRGALGGIAEAAVVGMRQEFGSDPRALRAGIGPCLCPDCLEVGDEVADAVAQVFPSSVLSVAGCKPHLDLALMITANLLAAGLPASAISRHQHCTRCRQERYFSHRGQGGCAGRFALIAWWQE